MLKDFLVLVLVFVGGYIFIRLTSSGVFRSYFEVRDEYERWRRGNVDDRSDEEKYYPKKKTTSG